MFKHSYCLIITLGLFISSQQIALAAPDSVRLHQVKSFAFALGSGALSDSFEKLKNYDLVIVDGDEASVTQIAALHSAGCIVLGYLSVGTIEPYRAWYNKAKAFRLDFWKDFDEYYADTSQSGFRDLIAKKIMPKILRKGFDGIFLDNVDMIADHRKQKTGMQQLVKSIASYVHKRNKYLFAQNGEDVLGRIFKSLDGWNREDVSSTYNFDSNSYDLLSQDEITQNLASITRIKARGIFVTAADYVKPGDNANIETARRNACLVGAISFVSNIDLTEIPASPLVCE